jgi:hypothetical protein
MVASFLFVEKRESSEERLPFVKSHRALETERLAPGKEKAPALPTPDSQNCILSHASGSNLCKPETLL